jgi:AGZA family xanthine/uracil permease-like MFS transporter
VAALQVWQVRGGMLIGIVGTALSGWTLGLVHWHPTPYSLSAITATAFKLDLRGALHFGLFEIVFVFLLSISSTIWERWSRSPRRPG